MPTSTWRAEHSQLNTYLRLVHYLNWTFIVANLLRSPRR